jgi:cell division ATPase FtsA
MRTPPTIRIDIDGMRHGIVHHLESYHADVERYVDEALKAAVKSFDYEAVVQAEASKAITECVRQVVGNAVREAFWNEDLRKAVNKAVRQAIAKAAK